MCWLKFTDRLCQLQLSYVLFVVLHHLSYCSFVCTGGSFLIIFWEAKHSGVYLTLYTPLLCVWRSLFEIWLSDGVYLNIATEFI